MQTDTAEFDVIRATLKGMAQADIEAFIRTLRTIRNLPVVSR